jgi:hypothetical protein
VSSSDRGARPAPRPACSTCTGSCSGRSPRSAVVGDATEGVDQRAVEGSGRGRGVHRQITSLPRVPRTLLGRSRGQGRLEGSERRVQRLRRDAPALTRRSTFMPRRNVETGVILRSTPCATSRARPARRRSPGSWGHRARTSARVGRAIPCELLLQVPHR